MSEILYLIVILLLLLVIAWQTVVIKRLKFIIQALDMEAISFITQSMEEMFKEHTKEKKE